MRSFNNVLYAITSHVSFLHPIKLATRCQGARTCRWSSGSCVRNGENKKPTPFPVTPFPTTPLRAQCAGASKRFCEIVSHCHWEHKRNIGPEDWPRHHCVDADITPNGWHTDPPRPSPVVRDDCSNRGKKSCRNKRGCEWKRNSCRRKNGSEDSDEEHASADYFESNSADQFEEE